jgi:restriction endonuclease Mrr
LRRPYVPVGTRAAKAIKKNPEKSNRAIAAELGVSYKAVRKAQEKTADNQLSPDKRIAKGGKSYPAKVSRVSDEDLTKI